MTREELKQKAINRIKETTPVLKDRSDIEIIAICHVRVEDYIAGAEPREKRIAELEAQIEQMKLDVISVRDEAERVEDVITHTVLNSILAKWEIKEND